MKKKFSAIVLASCIFTSQACAGLVDWAKKNPVDAMLVGGVAAGILLVLSKTKSSKHSNCKKPCCRKK